MKFGLAAFRSSIFNKVAGTFLLVLIPLYLILLIINLMGTNSIKNEISKSTGDRVHFYLSSFEREIQRIAKMEREYVVDKDIRELGSIADGMTDYERLQATLAIQSRLRILNASSNYIVDSRAFIPLIDRIISSNNYDTSINRDELNAMKIGKTSRKSPFTFWRNRIFLSLQYPNLYLGNEANPSFILGVELSIPQMKRELATVTNQVPGKALLVNLDQQWLIGRDGDDPVVEELEDFIRQERQKDRMKGVVFRELQSEKYLVSYEVSPFLNTALIVYLKEKEVLGPINTLRIWLWILSGVSVIIILLFSYSIYRMVHRPLYKLMHAFGDVEKGNMEYQVQLVSRDEFGYLYIRFNQMVSRLKQLIEEVYEQRIRNQRSELKRLQSQINPHFLYNSLFILYRMIKVYDNVFNLKAWANCYHAYPMIWIKDAAGKLAYGSIQPEMKTALKQLQDLYKAGLIDKEFGVKDTTKENELLVIGKIGLVFGAWWISAWPLPDAAIKDKKLVQDWRPYPLVSGDDKPFQNQYETGVDGFYVISKDCKHPEGVIELTNLIERYNYPSSEEELNHLQPLQRGKEPRSVDNKYWKLDPIMMYTMPDLKDSINAKIVDAFNKKDPSAVLLNPWAKDQYDKLIQYEGGDVAGWPNWTITGPGGTKTMSDDYLRNNQAYVNKFYGAPTKTMNEKKSTLDAKEQEIFTKIIMGEASIDEFDNFVKQWMSLGGEQITAEVNEWYDKFGKK